MPGWLRRPKLWLARPAALPRLALTSVVVNVLIVVTGGAVRLTGSGLGCPTWPSCTKDSLTPTKAYRINGIIEFTNRQLAFVVTAVVILTLLAAIVVGRQVRLAVLLAASIPAQAVLGGITVLTKLNPWWVAAHFLLSIAIISVAFVLWWRVREPDGDPGPGPVPLRLAATAMLVLTGAVLVVGTVVTGTGPHAGSKDAAHRIHLAPASMAQLHADLVMLLVGVTFGFVLLARAAAAAPRAQQAARWLLGIELAQGLIGYVQYFTHIPAVLVGIHMLGACLVWLAALTVLARLGVPAIPVAAVPRNPSGIALSQQNQGSRFAEPQLRG